VTDDEVRQLLRETTGRDTDSAIIRIDCRIALNRSRDDTCRLMAGRARERLATAVRNRGDVHE
jgi:hypothetical protein